MLLSGCRKLRALAVHVSADADFSVLAESPLELDFLDIMVESVEGLRVVSQLDVKWLKFQFCPSSEEFTAMPEWTEEARTALVKKAVPDVDLMLPAFSTDLLCAMGTCLRGARIHDVKEVVPLLPALALASPMCPNLLCFEVAYYEQLDAHDLEVVATNCPLLERVCLNADEHGFQRKPIDDGILALGLHCNELRHLDLYDRYVQRPVETLLKASAGWPKLTYICLAGIDEDGDGSWATAPEAICLPRTLGEHCPRLQELCMYPVPTPWWPTLLERLPLICKLDRLELSITMERHKSLDSYKQEVAALLRSKRKGLMEVTLLGLGETVPMAATIAACIEAEGVGVLTHIETSFFDLKKKGRIHSTPQIIIRLERA
eukprot:TRINITY_DN93690_c0_g1_i1.p1 TRINITY_DN93690_c0_g1~~TRINITY_DN93690_c0_g1_i1.p1  ORF type:complete len:386 (+),score=72.60 TRINITY_DN93690_c0_g1_i1:35-1159(+)